MVKTLVQPGKVINPDTQVEMTGGIAHMNLLDFSYPTIPFAACENVQIWRYDLPNPTDNLCPTSLAYNVIL